MKSLGSSIVAARSLACASLASLSLLGAAALPSATAAAAPTYVLPGPGGSTTPPLKGSVLELTLPRIAKLLKSGLVVRVSINQPGTVTDDLFSATGKLPAFASKHVPAAMLVGRGATVAKHAGTTKVLVRVTSRGRRSLEHAKRVKLVLITTLRATSGAKANLGRRTFTVKR